MEKHKAWMLMTLMVVQFPTSAIRRANSVEIEKTQELEMNTFSFLTCRQLVCHCLVFLFYYVKRGQRERLVCPLAIKHTRDEGANAQIMSFPIYHFFTYVDKAIHHNPHHKHCCQHIPSFKQHQEKKREREIVHCPICLALQFPPRFGGYTRAEGVLYHR